MRSVCALLLLCSTLFAQTNPQELAQEILKRFEHASLEDFTALVPVGDGRKLVALAVEHKLPRRPGLARVLQQSGDDAVLLVSGYAGGIPNSGDETVLGSQFSGLYQAKRRGETWRVERRIPIDETGRIHSQRLQVKIEPGEGLEIVDKLHITAEGQYGVVLRLNHRAAISSISWNGSQPQFEFAGGILWVKANGTGELDLRYRLEVEHGPNNTNSGCFLPDAGHVRDQYFWHPFFELSSEKDRADLRSLFEFRVSSVSQRLCVSGIESKTASALWKPAPRPLRAQPHFFTTATGW